jgi:hypothetical protein
MNITCISFDPGAKTTVAIVEKNHTGLLCQQFADIPNSVKAMLQLITTQKRLAFKTNQTCIVAIESLAGYVSSVARVASLFKIAQVVGNLEAIATLEELPVILLPAVGTKTQQGWRDILAIPQRKRKDSVTADALVERHLKMFLELPKTNNHVRDAIGLGVAAISIFERNSKIKTHERGHHD